MDGNGYKGNHFEYLWYYHVPDMSNLAFLQEFFQGGGKIYCYANFFCYANFSIVFGPNVGGGKSL